jgi:hypothetical protein
VRYLVDTHVWLWLLESPGKLSPTVRTALEHAEDLVLSAPEGTLSVHTDSEGVADKGSASHATTAQLVALGAWNSERRTPPAWFGISR